MKTLKASTRQLAFAEIWPEPTEAAVENRVVYNKIPNRKATFKSGMVAPFHRWFRLTPSFGDDLVRTMLEHLKWREGEVVLDPFSGAGTTIIECKIQGITSFGFEINPFLHFVCRVCTNWTLKHDKLADSLNSVEDFFLKNQKNLELLSRIQKPTISSIERWWRDDVLDDLLIIKYAINLLPAGEYRDVLLLALAAVLVPDLTNVTLGRLQLHFIDRSKHHIEAWPTFFKHAKQIIEDVKVHLGNKEIASSTIFHTDSRMPEAPTGLKANCVITSPPYPNRYSYVWNTRPHLYFFDLFQIPKQASDLDKVTIGGTWGTATSVLTKGIIEPLNQAVKTALNGIQDEIRNEDNMMANYVVNYFNELTKQIIAMKPFLAENARLAYVVGCSRTKEKFVETDVILAKIFEGIGFSVDTVERIRKRNSGKDLHESIVYCRKS